MSKVAQQRVRHKETKTLNPLLRLEHSTALFWFSPMCC